MKIRCDICTVANQLSSSQSFSPYAEFIHLSTSHKISLLCQKCLPVAEDELFYLPLNQENTSNNHCSKYLSNITSNFDNSHCPDLKTTIQSMFQTQIWQPFRQLQSTIMAYRSTLTQYKKKVRSEYKAVLSKIDPTIIKNFKQIVIQIHQQSPALYKSTRVAVQKQELDIIITAMKISAQNSWPDLEKLMETTKKSYNKFKQVFTNEKQELNKKLSLLKKILSKISIEHQYSKKSLDHGKRRRAYQDIDSDGAVLISEEDQQGSSNGSKSRLPQCPQNDLEVEQNPNREKQCVQLEPLPHKSVRECIQIQQDTFQLELKSDKRQNIAEDINQQKPKNQKNEVLLTQQKNKQQLKANQKKQKCLQNQTTLQQDRELIELTQIENLQKEQIKYQLFKQNDIKQTEFQKSPQITACRQINIDEQCKEIESFKPCSAIKEKPSRWEHNPPRSNKLQKPLNRQKKKLILTKTSTPIINQFEYFQISVDNYISPLQSLKSRLTTNIRIKQQLQKNNIPVANFINTIVPNDYRPHLKVIRHLKISYTRKKYLDQLLKFLPDCDNLEELTITEPLLATQEIINFIIMSLPKLRSLEFLCYNNLNQDHLNMIVEYLPNLEELYYGPKCYNNIALKSEYRQFREHKKQKRLSSLNNASLIEFLQQVSTIKNVWISQNESIQQAFQFLQDKTNLQHLIVGRYMMESTSPIKLPSQCWNSMLKLTGIQSLALINIQIDQKSLSTILSNNSQTLKSLQIYSCANWTDQLAAKLKNCRTLREFYLFGSDQSIFKGNTLWDAVTLQTLVLRSCQFMDYGPAQKKIGKLSQLKHIDLHGCEWFNDMILAQLVKNKYITYLNLANTQIGSLFQDQLRSLFKIRCLALGSTRINAAAIQELCNEFPDMEKLSLYNLCGSPVVNGRCLVKKNRLNKIGDILKSLRYIDVASLNTADDTMFDHFKNIKCIYLWMATSISKRRIQEMYDKGINIVDDA